MKQKAPLQQPPQTKSDQTHTTQNESTVNESAYGDSTYDKSAYNEPAQTRPAHSMPSMMGRTPEEMVQMMGADAFIHMTTAPDVYEGWMKERGLDKDPVYRQRHEMRMRMMHPERYSAKNNETVSRQEEHEDDDEQVTAKADHADNIGSTHIQRENEDEEVNAEEEESEENADLQRAGGADDNDGDDEVNAEEEESEENADSHRAAGADDEDDQTALRLRSGTLADGLQREDEDEEVSAEEEESEENADLQRAGGADDNGKDEIQEASLKVSSPTDEKEIEAEKVSDRVMTMPEPVIINQQKNDAISREAEDEGDQTALRHFDRLSTPLRSGTLTVSTQEQAQARLVERSRNERMSTTSPDITSRINQQRGSGTSLPESTQSFMENRMDADFSGVKIHNNSESFDLSKSINAKAFTVGNDVFFGQGQYAPETHSGKKLIAHELTHTLQNGSVQRKTIQRFFWDNKDKDKEKTETGEQKEEKAGGIRGKIDSMLRHIPGYSLVWLMLGKNYVTGLKVRRTPKNYVRAFLGVIPGGEFIYQQLDKAGAIDEALAYLNLQMKKYNVDPKVVKKQLSDWWENVSLWKVWKFGEYGNQLKSIIATPIRLLLMFGRFLWDKAKEMIFRGFLKMLGAPVKTVMGVLKRAGGALKKIFEDPKTFFKNLGSAIKTGFNKFTSNIWTYLKQGLFGWLLGAFSGTGLVFPKKFNLLGIFQLLAQIFGLTYQAIRARIVKGLGSMGEKIMGFLEKSFDFIKKLVVNGPLALWGVIKEKIGNIKQMFFGGIIGWLRNTIIVKALTRIALMLNPVGAIIGIVKAIYDIIMFFVNNWKRIVDLVSTIFNSLNEIAFGRIGKAAGFILGSLIKAVPIVISFLARLLNISGIVNKVKQIIGKIKKPVDKAVGKVVGWVVKKGKALWAKIKGVAGKVFGKAKAWWKMRKRFTTKSGKKHTLFFEGEKKGARLMIQSKKQPLDVFIKQFKSDKKKIDKYDSAKRIYDDIVVLINKNGDKFTKDKKGNVVTDPAFENDLQGKISVLVDLISIMDDQKDRIELCRIQFNSPASHFDKAEYYSQLQGQENGLNMLTVKKWNENRSAFIKRQEDAGNGRHKLSAKEQREFRQVLKKLLIEKYEDLYNMSRKDASKKAEEYLKGKAALHDPDQIAGGHYDALKRVGILGINSSLGSQWKNKIKDLDDHMNKGTIKNLTDDEKSKMKMNIKLYTG